MITFQHVHKSFDAGGSHKVVANDINAVFPSGVCVALLGRNGAGKSTLMQMVGGTVKPDSGLITVQGSISWPVGFAGSFHRDLTGAQNTRFIARAYGIDTDSLLEFVKDFAELDNHFHMPVRSYSSGMRSRLAFGISIGIPFDTYLVDEVTSVGDAAFKLKSRLVFLSASRHPALSSSPTRCHKCAKCVTQVPCWKTAISTTMKTSKRRLRTTMTTWGQMKTNNVSRAKQSESISEILESA